jgi:adenylate cyclase
VTVAPIGELQHWLLSEGVRQPGCYGVMQGLCDRLIAGGLHLHRANLFGLRLHPEVRAVSSIWRRDGSGSDEPVSYDDDDSAPAWQLSPLKHIIIDGGGEVRRRIAPELRPFDFPILDDLMTEGCSDYLCLPLIFSDGQRCTLSFVTDAADGFSASEIDLLRQLVPTMATVSELVLRRHLAETLLNTYLGVGPGREVLSGAITRGGYRLIEAAILIADLRDFSTLSNQLPPEEIVTLLNWFFDIVVTAVTAQGGEVLKFTGDGLLAIFPVTATRPVPAAAEAVVAAATHAAAKLHDQISPLREDIDHGRLLAGFGLHLGQVIYGNIGSSGRLDFTAIGAAVNLTARIEGLTRSLNRSILISPAIAALLGGRCRTVGSYDLKGFSDPVEIYALP